MTPTTKLGTVTGHRNMRSLTVALFNLQGVNAFGLARASQDTLFTYDIYTEKRLSKPRLTNLESFIAGYLAALSATGNENC